MRRFDDNKSRFFSIENHFLNTFFSGLYISAGDLINIGKKNDIELSMHSRELLIKELLNSADKNSNLNSVISAMLELIDERIDELHRLSLSYPDAREPLATLAQKCVGSKSLLAREMRGAYQ